MRQRGIGQVIADDIACRTGAENRVTVPGHVQRGGSPVPLDRMPGAAFGVCAVDLVAQGRLDRMVARQDRRVVDVPLEEAIRGCCRVDPDGPMVHAARGPGISFGDW